MSKSIRVFNLPPEYILVSDQTSKVLKSSENYYEIKKLANLIRRGGGKVTIFKAMKA